jgi:hypothetical protein
VSSLPSDWVVAIAVIGIAFVARTAVRWKSGRHRHFRMTFVLEKDYEGPKPPEEEGGGQPGGDQPPPDQNGDPPPS